MADAGANAFRFIVFPWNWEIEFEKIGNYYDRLPNAYEMDQVIEKATELGLRMQINMKVQYALENPSYYTMYGWDWDYDKVDMMGCCNGNGVYCYRTDLGLNSPLEFFTDDDARTHFKNRLRYMIARWGYSPNIYLWELYSEINGFGGGVDPVVYEYDNWCQEDDAIDPTHLFCTKTCDDPTNETGGPDIDPENCYPLTSVDVRTTESLYTSSLTEAQAKIAVREWHHEMADFIKNELHHNRQLLSTNYVPAAPLFGNCGPGTTCFDNSFCSADIDVITWNNYGASQNRFDAIVNDYNNEMGKLSCNIQNLFGEEGCGGPTFRPQKPIMFGENGIGDARFSCDYTWWYKDLWMTPFTGYASSGMQWDERLNYDAWTEFGKLNAIMSSSFLENIDLLNQEWIPGYVVMDQFESGDSDLAEAVYLKHTTGSGDNTVIGVLSNRSYNWFTKNTDPNSQCANNTDENGDELINPSIDEFVAVEYEGNNEVEIPGMGLCADYEIIYYDPETAGVISTENTATTFGGRLSLEDFPTLTASRPLILFRINDSGPCWSSTEAAQDSTGQYPASEHSLPSSVHGNFSNSGLALDLSAYPTPTSDVINIACNLTFDNPEVSVVSVLGQRTDLNIASIPANNIDISWLAAGFYHIEITANGSTWLLPFIKS